MPHYQQGLATLLVGAMLASCAANPATGRSNFSLVSEAKEREIGQQTAEQALKQYGMYKPDSKATKYVTDLCYKTYAVTEEAGKPVSCIFLNSEEFNAWATPGYINVYRGLLPYVQTEAQLAAVIAHETGHTSAHHIAQKITGQTVAGVLTSIAGIYIAQKSDNSSLNQLAMMGGSLAAGAALASYSRGDELEADALGQRYMERMGYDKRESVAMTRSMLAKEAYDYQVATAFNKGKPLNESFLGRLYASHPPTPERIAQAVKIAGGEPDGSVKLPPGIQPATPPNDPQGRNRFLNAIDGLEYGPARQYGIAGRDYIAIPKVRFAWQLPDGFVMDYIPSGKADTIGTWRGIHPQSGVRFKTMMLSYKAGMNVGYALQELYPSLDNNSVQRVAMKNGDTGNAAYTAALQERFGSEAGRIVAVALPETDTLAVIMFVAPDVQTLAREEGAIMSRLQQSNFFTDTQARQIQPLHLKAFTATAADTVAKRAAALPQGALREELFRAINGLAPADALVVGQRYKTVADTNNL